LHYIKTIVEDMIPLWSRKLGFKGQLKSVSINFPK
jgi:hypothetical protein